jgi:flagellin
MGLVVNTNIASINAQRQLSSSGADLDQASERLASGKRINSAADDAAGLAIANRQTSQIRGLDQAIRNANDGISLIQTAEGALDATSNILQRVRELSVQSANGIYSDTDRATINAEVEQLTSELDRIAESTAFNGQKILDGSLSTLSLQVGAEAGDSISIAVQGFSADSLGGKASADVVGTEGGSVSTATLLASLNILDGVTTDGMTLNGQDVGDLSGATGNLTEALDIMNSNVAGVEVSAFVERTAAADGDGLIRSGESVSFTVLGQDGATNTIEITNTGSMDDVVAAINKQGGDFLSAELNDDGRLVLSSDTAATVTIGDTGATALTAIGIADAAAIQASLAFDITDDSIESVDIAYTGTQTATIIGDIGVQTRTAGDITGSTLTTNTTALAEGDLVINDVEIGLGVAGSSDATAGENLVTAINAQSALTGVVASDDGAGALSLNSVDGSEISIDFAGATATLATTGLIETNNSSTKGDTVDDIDISTQTGATAAIEVVDAALEQINSQRADLGAINNRLDFTVSNLSNVSENTSAARSRIMDADFASETAELSRAQVLQQASQAILAQANARPQQVLSLLN